MNTVKPALCSGHSPFESGIRVRPWHVVVMMHFIGDFAVRDAISFLLCIWLLRFWAFMRILGWQLDLFITLLYKYARFEAVHISLVMEARRNIQTSMMSPEAIAVRRENVSKGHTIIL